MMVGVAAQLSLQPDRIGSMIVNGTGWLNPPACATLTIGALPNGN